MAIEENDAFQVFQSIDTLPEDVRPRAALMLSDYRKQQETAGLPLWPAQEKSKQDRRQRMQAAFDNPLELDKDDGSFIQADRIQAGLGDTLRKREASILWLADRYGADEADVRQRLDFYKADASEKWGSGLLDDSAFFAKAKGEVEKGKQIELIQQDAFTMATQAAWSSKPMLSALNEWQGMELGPQEKTKLEQTPVFMRAYREAAEKQRPYRGVIADVVKMARGMDDNPDGFQFSEMADRLLTVPPQDRALVLEAIANSGAKPEEGRAVLLRLAMSMDRGLDRLVDTGITGFVGKAMSDLEQSAQISPLITEEQRAQLTSETSRTQDYLDLRDDMREIASSQLSPLKDVRFMGANLSGVAENLPMTISSFAPYIGPALLVGSMQRDTANSLRRDYPGMSRADRESVAAWSAPFQAATEVISDRLLLGRLPNLRRVFSSPALSARGIAAQFTQRVGVGAATETAEEFVQGVTPMLVMEAQQALQKDVPDANWGRFFEGFGNNLGELAAVILPMALIGAGAGQISDFSNARDLAQDERALIAAKYSPEGAAKIAEAAKAGDWQTVQDLMRADWKTVNAKAEPLSEVASRAFTKASTEIAAEVQQGKSEAAQALEQSATKGIFPRIRADVNGWAVEDLDTGSMVRVGSRAEAIELAYSGMSDKERQSAESMAQMADEFLGDRSRPEAFEITKNEQRLEDEVKAGRVTQEQVREAAQLYGQLHGLTAEEARIEALEVLGNNLPEENEGVREYVSRIHGGGNLITVIHEGVHGRWNAGLKNGHYSQAQGLMWVRMAEQASGVQFLPVSDDAAVSSAMLDEAITEIVSADVIGRRKDVKQHFSPGLISRGISAFALSQRAEAKQAGKLAVFLKSWKGFWGKVLRNAKALQKARKEGKIGEDFDAFLDDLLGAEPQVRYEAQAAREAAGMASTVDNAPFSLRGISESEAKTPMTIYRAGDADEKGIKPWASFTPEKETAEAYLDNPGFGGSSLRAETVAGVNDIYEMGRPSVKEFRKLAERIGLDSDVGQDWFDNGWQYPWEESSKVKRLIEDSGIDAIQYTDDFPAGATTIVFTREPELISDPNTPFSLRAVPTSEIQTIPEDLERAKADAERAGPGWAASVDLSEPVGVYRDKEGNLKLFDGHHRWLAADMRGEPLQVRESVFESAPFSLGPRSLAAVADTVLASKMRSPEFREGFYTEARRRLAKLHSMVSMQKAAPAMSRVAEIQAEIEAGRADYEAELTQLRQDRDFEIAGAKQDKAGKLAQEKIKREFDQKITQRQKDWLREKATLEAKLGADDVRQSEANAKDAKERQMMALRTLDAILSAFPPEVRGRVGGFVKLASLNTDKAREAEIERRLLKLDDVVESEARKYYAAKIEKQLKRYKSQKDKSGRISGKLISTATEQVDYAAYIAGLDVEKQANETAALEKTIQDSDNSEAVQDALNRLGILRLFEVMDLKDSESLESSAQWLADTIEQGKLGKKVLDEARKEFLDQMRTDAQAQVLEGEVLNIDEANNLSNMNRAPVVSMLQNLRGMLSEALWTTAQRLEIIFGEGSAPTEYFASRVVNAANRSTDIKRNVSAQQREILGTIFGSNDKFTHARGIAKLQEPRQSGVTIRRVTTKDITLDIDTLTKLSDGTMKPETAGIREDELTSALDEWAASDRKRSVTITQTVNAGEPTERFMSELQGIQWRLWWNQADSKKQMERDGWTDESIKQLDAFLSPQARQLGEWISSSYQDAAAMIDPIYRRLFNAPLPRVKGYAPIYRMTLSTDADMMDLSNSDMNSGLAAGFTKSRVNTTAPLLEIDALAAFLSHWENVSHWVSHAELMRDMKAVLMDRDVSTAIRQKKGDGVLSRLKEDIKTIESNGTNSAKELTNLSRGWRWLMQYRAYKGLAFRLSPIVKQTPALLNPLLADVPAHNYAAGLSRALTSPQEFASEVSAMWNSDIIRRRIEGGFSTESRIAQQGSTMTGSQAIVLMQAGMMPMAYVDAGWTALGSAVAFNYYRRAYLSQNAGATPEMADAHATARLERMIATSEQPSDIVNRSLYERSTNPFMRSMTMFVSDQRKALAIEVLALRKLATGKSKNKALDVQRVLVAHFIQAAVSQVIAAGLASMFGDDDDKEREWSIEQWGLALTLGPVNGLFVLGRLIDKIGRTALGLRIFPNNDLAGKAADDLIRGTKSMDELFNPDDPEDVMTSMDALSTAAASVGSYFFGPAAAAVDVSANIVREVSKMISED